MLYFSFNPFMSSVSMYSCKRNLWHLNHIFTNIPNHDSLGWGCTKKLHCGWDATPPPKKSNRRQWHLHPLTSLPLLKWLRGSEQDLDAECRNEHKGRNPWLVVHPFQQGKDVKDVVGTAGVSSFLSLSGLPITDLQNHTWFVPNLITVLSW